MDKIRLRYSKTGKAKYISHLDLMATMQRALLRAGVSLKYSDGFNPRPYTSIALPLPVGSESVCELMDVALRAGGIQDRVNAFMPEGLGIQKAYRGFRNFNEIKWIDAQCKLIFDDLRIPYNDGILKELTDILTDSFSLKRLIIPKKTKRGISEIDAAQHIKDAAVSSCEDERGNACIYIRAKISAQNPTISNKDITAIAQTVIPGSGRDLPLPSIIEMKRIEIYDASMVLFK